MPELPEVETIVRELKRKITGKNLRRFSVFDGEKIKNPGIVFPKKILGVARRGKYIVCETSGGLKCLIHLRMTGALLTKSRQTEKRRERHERARFDFSDDSSLRFVDVRRFGTIKWVKRDKDLPVLGIEPLSAAFNARALGDILKKSSPASPRSRGSRRPIKSFLLDQRLIAGIGNIYADESLWFAKINPKRRMGALKTGEIKRLIAAIKNVLREAIRKGGSSMRDYRRTDGGFGYYQKFRKVYGREGLPCPRCGGKIKRIKIGGRSSYFCQKCQK